jgi:SagB-type dehydrogenase family enzyme
MGTKQKTKSREKPAPPEKTAMTLDQFLARELTPLADVVTFCNNLPMSIYAGTTVVKSPEVVFRGLMLSQNRLVSEEYLLNFRRSEADLGVVIGTNNFSLPMAVGSIAARGLEENEDDLIALPPYQNERAPLGPVIRSRRSIRRFAGKPISLQELSTVLAHAAGITGRMELQDAPRTVALGDDPHVDLRAAVSGGALYPVDLCIVALNIEKLPVGVYRYLPKHHALKPIVTGRPLPEIRKLAQFAEMEVEKAAFLVAYVYNFFENSRKYGEAGMGFAFIEAGGMAAHIHLLCTALGLGSCDIGGFSKRRFERILAADGVSRHMIHLTVVGK